MDARLPPESPPMSANVLPFDRSRAKAPATPAPAAPKRQRLTENKAATLPAPAAGAVYIWDATVPALAVRVTAAGARSYVCRRWDAARGKSERATLGRVGDMSLATARQMAQELVQAATAGGSGLKTASRRRSASRLTLDTAFDAYCEDRSHLRTLDTYKALWRFHVAPSGLGDMLAADIVTDDLDRLLLARLRNEGKLHTADKLRAILSAVYQWHTKRDLLPRNPVQAIGLRTAGQHRTRSLTPDEAVRLGKALDAAGEPWRDYFRLLLMTGARRNEALSMRFEHLDLGSTDKAVALWTLPAARSKNGQPIVRRLTPAAAAILLARRESYADADGEGWVFPSPRNTTAAAINPRKAWAAVLIRAGLADVRLHDLRRTLGVWAARGGANAAQIQALLGHRDRRSSEVYSWLAGDAGEAGAAVGRLASKALGL